MPRQSQITVQPESSEIDQTPKSIVRQKRGEISKGTAPVGIAIHLEELEIAFDPDLRAAIIARLIRDKALILEAATQERRLSQALESARLESIEKARAEGIQIAREAKLKEKQAIASQTKQQFINKELPELLDACEFLEHETMKQTVERFASCVGVRIEWKDLEDGRFECIPH